MAPFIVAGFTGALSCTRNVGVACVVSVALRAVGDQPAVLAPASILGVWDHLKVFRPDARRHAAEVVCVLSLRWLANQKVMGQRSTAIEPKAGVAVILERSRPQPAWPEVWSKLRQRPVLIDLGPEALFSRWPRFIGGAVSPPSLIVLVAKAVGHMNPATAIYGTGANVAKRCGGFDVAACNRITEHWKPILSGVTQPDVPASRLLSILPQVPE